MTRKIVVLTVLVLALPPSAPPSAVADGGVASSIVNLMTTLPEPSTLGFLGSGRIGSDRFRGRNPAQAEVVLSRRRNQELNRRPLLGGRQTPIAVRLGAEQARAQFTFFSWFRSTSGAADG